jgi:hypothetical protein
MKHFKLQEWIEFTRNMVSAEHKAEMQRHLQRGCEECGKTVQLWQHVGETAARESQYQPPDRALRVLQGLFALQRPAKDSVITRLKLAFDSLANPLPAGIRSGGTSARQLLYRNGNYSVDLRVELQADSGRIAMVGQVLNSDDPGRGIADIPVSLQSSDGKWQGVTTNPMGEFHFDCPHSEKLELSFGVNAKRTLVISIPLTPETPSPETWL